MTNLPAKYNSRRLHVMLVIYIITVSTIVSEYYSNLTMLVMKNLY